MVAANDEAKAANSFQPNFFLKNLCHGLAWKEKMAEQNGLAELLIQINHSSFRLAVVWHIFSQVVAVFIEVDETHLEEWKAQDLIVAGGIAEDILWKELFHFRAREHG